jgi:hypothetical protein
MKSYTFVFRGRAHQVTPFLETRKLAVSCSCSGVHSGCLAIKRLVSE